MIRRNLRERANSRMIRNRIKERLSKRMRENYLQDDEVFVKLTISQLQDILENVNIDPDDLEVTDLNGNQIYDVYSLVWDAD